MFLLIFFSSILFLKRSTWLNNYLLPLFFTFLEYVLYLVLSSFTLLLLHFCYSGLFVADLNWYASEAYFYGEHHIHFLKCVFSDMKHKHNGDCKHVDNGFESHLNCFDESTKEMLCGFPYSCISYAELNNKKSKVSVNHFCLYYVVS